jgi:RNA 2',3'-cyclic 3'-phosphodiesterase
MARLFFALWPGADAAARLAEVAAHLAAQSGGKTVPPARIHLTLAFLGEVAAPVRASLLGIEAKGERFRFTLDRVGSFRDARVAWAGASAPPPALLALQSWLAGEIAARGCVLEKRAFAPHVTLVRKIGKAVPGAAMEPVAWEARELALVRSEAGTGRYWTERTWMLGENGE